MRRLALIALLCLAVSAQAGAAGRSYIRDLAAAAGRALTGPEREIAEYVLVYRLARAGLPLEGSLPEALARLDAPAYREAIGQAARVATSKAAKGLLGLGKAGEKLLKALIVAAERAGREAGRAIDEGAAEYDRRRR